MSRVQYIVSLVLSIFMVFACTAYAADTNVVEPDKVVSSVTKDLMAIAKTGKEKLKTDPDAYFVDVRTLLEGSIDFNSIAKGVMGKRHWLASTEDQRAKFADVFTDTLVKTYGKGMANFADFDIQIESSIPSEKSPNAHYVVQSVKTDTGVNKVIYSMRLSDVGWRLTNVNLNGVDLGKTFRSQFDQAVKDNGNDVGLAIAGWGK